MFVYRDIFAGKIIIYEEEGQSRKRSLMKEES